MNAPRPRPIILRKSDVKPYTNSQGRRLGRADYLAFVMSGDMRWDAQVIEDAAVASFGETAVLTCHVTDVGRWRGEPVRWRFVSTQVYVRRGETFVYAAGHTSSPAD